MITPKEIAQKTMTIEKRNEIKKDLFPFYVIRPISYFMTVPLLYTNITANCITIISIIFTIVGFTLLSIGNTMNLQIFGWVFFFLWNVFDNIDGNIARYKKITSPNGDLLDTLGGYLAISLTLLGMGAAAFFESGNYLYFIVSGISAVSTLIPRTLTHRMISLEKNENNSAIELKNKEEYSVAKVIALNICDPAGFQMVFMLIAIIFHMCSLFTALYAILNVLVMTYSIIKLMK